MKILNYLSSLYNKIYNYLFCKPDNYEINIYFKSEQIGKIQTISHKPFNGYYRLYANRVFLYTKYLRNIFISDLISANAQKMPFDIVIIKNNKPTTTFPNVWIVDFGFSYVHEDYIFISNINFEAETKIVH